MKNRLLLLAAFIVCAVLPAAQAQPPHRPGGMTGIEPHGPDFAGPIGRLFTDNSSFSASLEMRIANTNTRPGMPIIFSGNIAVSGAKSRFEIDMTKTGAALANPQNASNLVKMGLDKIIIISRPDRKISDIIYPGFNAYAEMPAVQSAETPPGSFKADVTKLGDDTLDGQPCVKNKVVLTDDKGNLRTYTVWNAIDLKSFPLKIDQAGDNGVVTTMTFKDIKLENPSADKFEAPAGASKYDSVGSLIQQEITKRAHVVRMPQ